MIAALYVDPRGPYVREGVDLWDKDRDARGYKGPHPVVAHPPCERWGNFWNAKGRKLGDDGGCFKAALAAVRRWGGVLEHPKGTRAFKAFGLPRPSRGRWLRVKGLLFAREREWVCEVDQSLYGHKAKKPTWLFYVGPRPPDLRFGQGNHVQELRKRRGRVCIGMEVLGGRARALTPPAFADVLIQLAERSRDGS